VPTESLCDVRSARAAKCRESLLKQCWALSPLQRNSHLQPSAMHALQPVLQDRLVSLFQDVTPDLHNVIGTDADELAVERGVTEFVQGETI
jgi:hypothetical protein